MTTGTRRPSGFPPNNGVFHHQKETSFRAKSKSRKKTVKDEHRRQETGSRWGKTPSQGDGQSVVMVILPLWLH